MHLQGCIAIKTETAVSVEMLLLSAEQSSPHLPLTQAEVDSLGRWHGFNGFDGEELAIMDVAITAQYVYCKHITIFLRLGKVGFSFI